MDNKRRAALLADEFAIKFGLGSSFADEALWLRERVEVALNEADRRGQADKKETGEYDPRGHVDRYPAY